MQAITITIYDINVAIAAPKIPIECIKTRLKTMFSKAATKWIYKLNFVFLTSNVIFIPIWKTPANSPERAIIGITILP